jgi:uncharacterized membrane protein YeaQ/YmgE (transglycosylase-associated protein family)
MSAIAMPHPQKTVAHGLHPATAVRLIWTACELVSQSSRNMVVRVLRDEGEAMSIIGWIIIGALAGWIASMIMGRNEEMGWLGNIVVGIVGAIVGGLIYGFITGDDFVANFSIGTVLVAILGAIVVLFIWNAIRGRATH